MFLREILYMPRRYHEDAMGKESIDTCTFEMQEAMLKPAFHLIQSQLLTRIECYFILLSWYMKWSDFQHHWPSGWKYQHEDPVMQSFDGFLLVLFASIPVNKRHVAVKRGVLVLVRLEKQCREQSSAAIITQWYGIKRIYGVILWNHSKAIDIYKRNNSSRMTFGTVC